MFKKLSLLVIALLLLIQFTTCLPKPSASESAKDNIIPHGAATTTTSVGDGVDRKRLEAFVFKGHINFLNFCLERTNQIAKDALADPSMNSIESQAMESERDALTKYIKDSKEALNSAMPMGKSEKNSRFFFGMGKEFVLDKFNSVYRSRISNPTELTAEQQLSWEALKKHGVLEYNEEMEKRSKDFACHIVDEFEKYIKTLSADEKDKEKEFVEVWDKFTKNELDLDKAEFGQKLLLRLFVYESEK